MSNRSGYPVEAEQDFAGNEFVSKFKLGLGVYEAIEACAMEKPGAFNFEVGQLAELRSFEEGFRGAWFRCKIKDILLKQNKILPEYYDYDLEEL
ncbi:hypothetical protein L1987_19079 [Smallanthus sonchifolius]|uniref:Uncharacterized protein n=1 Tax=Smallanthus sonchifolius TaxID=185202 RepID=A0ACB9J1H8_9ASTR|nr:hypothetical protein L1987_19079 [Smallanthus sonchifolius]